MNKVTPLCDEPSSHPIVTPVLPPLANPHTCRICLEEETPLPDLGMQMLVACECSGSVGHVHHKCLMQWIHKQLSNTGNRRAYCQICKAELFFKMSKAYRCECRAANCFDVSGCNLVCLVVQLVLIAAVAVVIGRMSPQSNPLLRLLLLIVVGITCSLLLITMVTIFKEAFVRGQRVIERIYSREESEERGLCERRGARSSRVLGAVSMRSVSRQSQLSNRRSRASIQRIVRRPRHDSISDDTSSV